VGGTTLGWSLHCVSMVLKWFSAKPLPWPVRFMFCVVKEQLKSVCG